MFPLVSPFIGWQGGGFEICFVLNPRELQNKHTLFSVMAASRRETKTLESSFPPSEPLAWQVPGYWYNNFEWDSEDGNSNSHSDSDYGGSDLDESNWDLDGDTSWPMTPEDLGSNRAPLGNKLNNYPPPAASSISTARKRQASEPGPSTTSLAASAGSTPPLSNIPPVKKAHSKSMQVKEKEGWPPEMLSE